MEKKRELSPEERFMVKNGFDIDDTYGFSFVKGKYKGHVYELHLWGEGSARFISMNFSEKGFPSEIAVIYDNNRDRSKLMPFLTRFVEAKDKLAFMKAERKAYLLEENRPLDEYGRRMKKAC